MKDEKQREILPAIVNRILNLKKSRGGRLPGAAFRWWTGLRALKGENGLLMFVDMNTEEGNVYCSGGDGGLGVGFHGNCGAKVPFTLSC